MHNIFRKGQTVLCVVAVLLAVVIPISSCTSQKSDTDAGITPGVKEATVFVASDLHLYSENLLGSDNELYVKENFSSDGRIQECDYRLVRALVDEVNEQKPGFLVITGDLSYNGEKDSHTELAKLLGEIQDTKTLVIPGNHDLYSLDAFSAEEDKAAPMSGIDSETFREIYAEFGYTGAYSYDEHSLSYIYEMGEDIWALMLDTTQSKYNEENGFNIVSGFLEEPTMLWLEENLKYAKEHGISVVSFSHHNLLVHNELFKSSYTLYNYEELLALYAEYDVSLNFSGHLHIQSIQSERVKERDVYDVSSGSLLCYANRYGRLDIYDNCYSYESCLLDLSDDGEDLRDYSFGVFSGEYYAKTVTRYTASLGERQGEAAIRLLSEINAYYFDGSYEQIRALTLSHRWLVTLIRAATADYDTSYVKSVMDVPARDQHTLLIEKQRTD